MVYLREGTSELGKELGGWGGASSQRDQKSLHHEGKRPRGPRTGSSRNRPMGPACLARPRGGSIGLRGPPAPAAAAHTRPSTAGSRDASRPHPHQPAAR